MDIYRLALQVQDASNLSGVAHSLSKEVLPVVWDEARARGRGTDYVNTHPAVVLFVDKLASLAHVQGITDLSMDAYSEASRICERRQGKDYSSLTVIDAAYVDSDQAKDTGVYA